VARTKRTKRRARPHGRPRAKATRTPATAEVRRARFVLLGAFALSAVVLVAWFPASSLLSQRSQLAGTQSQLSSLHTQDAALAQEKKNLSDGAEIGRIAREQYQLVSPGQQPYEVLPPTGSVSSGIPYAGDPGSEGPVTPSASSELPPGEATTTTSTTPEAPAAGGTAGHASARQASGARGQQGSGLASRIVRALEFWR
jgi:cell division protein FtsB